MAIVEGMLKIDGADFVLISADEFLRLGGDEWRLTGLPPRKARENALATRVREARKHVGLTQVQLATRLGKSQTMVSHAESGIARVNERYVHAVLEACGLRRTWGLPQGGRPDAPIAPEEIAGLDPETCEVVMRGTKRDRELGQKYAWWNNRCSIG
ncbi:MAG TPA: helix-turn-helix transcriptional regulator [Polyangiaceae bacterium]|nr:helix-turn-helix transcriptional regulator [Polyangiaceae bacterium]